MENANFQYFWEQCDPKTGIVKDRCNVRASDKSVLGSIAATGFGLTALCIGEKTRLHFLRPGPRPRSHHFAFSLEENAE